MGEEKELTKEERIAKAKELMEELKKLELSDEELESINGGNFGPNPGDG